MKKVLVISVHPDDETIGCGGTIFHHLAKGDEVYCAWITNGNKKQGTLIPEVEKAFSFKKTYKLEFPEITLNEIALKDIIDKISYVFNDSYANIIYLPNRCDPHSDHRKAFDACQACIKSFRYPFIEKVMMMEVISETDFAPMLPENIYMPHVYVDISKYFDMKINVLKIFQDEMLSSPLTRSFSSMKAFNRYRGSQINTEFAESFMLLKDIIRD